MSQASAIEKPKKHIIEITEFVDFSLIKVSDLCKLAGISYDYYRNLKSNPDRTKDTSIVEEKLMIALRDHINKMNNEFNELIKKFPNIDKKS